MSPQNPAVPPPMGGVPPKKKLSPVVIILIVLGGLMLLGTVLVIAGGLFIFHKVKQAGIDPDLMERNPALAATKLIAATNPEVDVVSVDEGSGKITLREKKTGKTITLDFEQVKQGKITFEGDEGKVTVEGSAEGNRATLRVQTPEGSYQYNANAGKLPRWAPAYPKAEQKNIGSSETSEGKGYMVQLTTTDSVEKVLTFYKDQLEAAGLTVQTVQHGEGAVITGQSADEKKNGTVTIGQADGGTTIGATFLEKK